jgi:hypothetical protein
MQAVAIKPLVGMSFDTTINSLYIGAAKTAICGNERFLTQHIALQRIP